MYSFNISKEELDQYQEIDVDQQEIDFMESAQDLDYSIENFSQVVDILNIQSKFAAATEGHNQFTALEQQLIGLLGESVAQRTGYDNDTFISTERLSDHTTTSADLVVKSMKTAGVAIGKHLQHYITFHSTLRNHHKKLTDLVKSTNFEQASVNFNVTRNFAYGDNKIVNNADEYVRAFTDFVKTSAPIADIMSTYAGDHVFPQWENYFKYLTLQNVGDGYINKLYSDFYDALTKSADAGKLKKGNSRAEIKDYTSEPLLGMIEFKIATPESPKLDMSKPREDIVKFNFNIYQDDNAHVKKFGQQEVKLDLNAKHVGQLLDRSYEMIEVFDRHMGSFQKALRLLSDITMVNGSSNPMSIALQAVFKASLLVMQIITCIRPLFSHFYMATYELINSVFHVVRTAIKTGG